MQIGFIEVVNGCELERNWINEGGGGEGGRGQRKAGGARGRGGGWRRREEEMNESLT